MVNFLTIAVFSYYTCVHTRKAERLVYTLANQMQILRLILHDKKKRKYRPDAKGKWVWIEEEEYDGRKYK